MMIALSLFYVFVLAITFRTIRKQRPAQKFSNEIFRVREIGMTSVLGALLWLEAGAILAYGITLPERLSGGFSSDLNVFGFLVLSILLGAYMQLYYFVKAIVVTDAGIVGISVWGKQTVLEWQDISEIRVSMLRRVTLGGHNGSVTVGGEKKAYARFLRLAVKKIQADTGNDILIGLNKTINS